MSWRAELERRSVPVLRRLDALPRWFLLVAVVALLLAGLMVHGALSAAVLLVLAAFLGWLMVLSWPALDPPARLLRALVAAALVVVALRRL